MILFVCFVAHAQTDTTTAALTYKDEEFNIFLFSLLALFICGLFGAAFVGALAAALVFGFLFLLVTLGIISTATIVAIYKRSYTAGFMAFLLLISGIGCGIVGCIAFILIGSFFQLPVSRTTFAVIGLLSGISGGLLMAKLSAKILKHVLTNFLKNVKGFASQRTK